MRAIERCKAKVWKYTVCFSASSTTVRLHAAHLVMNQEPLRKKNCRKDMDVLRSKSYPQRNTAVAHPCRASRLREE